MPKITRHGGPTIAGTDETGEPEVREPATVLWKCSNCQTEYAAGLAACPHCGSEDYVEIAGPGYLEQAPAAAEETGDDDADDDDSDETAKDGDPSPGSSSATSSPKRRSNATPSGGSDPKPAPATASPSSKDPEESSTAPSTAGSGRRTSRPRSSG